MRFGAFRLSADTRMCLAAVQIPPPPCCWYVTTPCLRHLERRCCDAGAHTRHPSSVHAVSSNKSCYRQAVAPERAATGGEAAAVYTERAHGTVLVSSQGECCSIHSFIPTSTAVVELGSTGLQGTLQGCCRYSIPIADAADTWEHWAAQRAIAAVLHPSHLLFCMSDCSWLAKKHKYEMHKCPDILLLSLLQAKSKPSAKHQAPSEQRVTTTEEPHQPSASASLNDIATGTAVPLPWSCSDDALLQLIASRDPTGVGLGGGLGVRLLQRLLAWEPTQRPTATQALQHAYFVAAEHMQMTGSIVADAFYQGLLVHCSELSAGERGWC